MVVDGVVAHGDAALRGELHGIGDEVVHGLHDTAHVAADLLLRNRELGGHLNTLGDAGLVLVNQLGKHHIDVEGRDLQLLLTGLNLGDVHDVVDDAQQLLVVLLYQTDKLLTLSIILNIRQHAGEADDGIQRGTDFVTHVGNESRLQTVTLLCPRQSLLQGELQLLTTVDALGGTHDEQRLAIDIALGNDGIALFPVGLRRVLHHDTVLLVVAVTDTCTELVHRLVDTDSILLDKHGRILPKRATLDAHSLVLTLLAIVLVIIELARLSIDMPDGETHGLQHEVELHVLLLLLIELLQFLLKLVSRTTLPDNGDNKGKENQDTYSPENELKVLFLLTNV